jgi:anthranilate synthase component 1
MSARGAVRQKDRIVVELPGDKFTPLGLAIKLEARALLESASFERGRERYSILLLREAFTIQQTRDELFLLKESGRGGWQRLEPDSQDILNLLSCIAEQHGEFQPPYPFPAGGIGYLSYEYARRFDTIRFREREDPLALPEASFLFGHLYLVYDHYTERITLVGLNYREHSIDLEAAVEETVERIGDLDFNFLTERPRSYAAEIVPRAGDREEFLAGVGKVKEQIVAGNLLQGVLSRRLEVRTRLPALEAYRNLRSVNPSPYLFYLDFDRFQLFGASPEVHVKVKKGTVTVRPIAGTRPRGRDDREELALEKELLADEKERAEHLMLVDLARNDIGRVCRPGSVRVTESMAVERYSHVIHMVSQVQGELTAGRNGIDAVRATFPAGTVSGAPKIRAIETIDALEPFRRGFYAGIVGYVEPGGSLDTCITIRSAVKIGDRLVLQAGAGIVYDSVPEREYEETENKLRALTVAAGLSVGTSNDGPSTAERRSGAVPVTADGDTADADVSTADRRSGANAGEPA